MSTPVITIFVRHAEGCKHAADAFSKRCNCRKHLRWFAQGKQQFKGAGTRAWAEAEKVKRELEDQLSGKVRIDEPGTGSNAKTIQEAVDTFLADKKVSNISKAVQNVYKLELSRLRHFMEQAGVFTVQGMTRELLTAFCATWPEVYASSYTRFRVRERLQGFIKFCYDGEWLRRKLPLPMMMIDEPPTMPLTSEEFARALAAIPTALDKPEEQQRARALILLMRWTGLSIRDAVTLPRAEIQHDAVSGMYRVVTERQKTGTHVSVPLKPSVALEVLALPPRDSKWVFWNGTTDARMFSSRCSQKYIVDVFNAAGIVSLGNMKSHRLRDTFAVDLLEKGVPMEEVSKLLGHESIRTTEKHYAKWVKGRQDRLDSLVSGTWGGLAPAVPSVSQLFGGCGLQAHTEDTARTTTQG